MAVVPQEPEALRLGYAQRMALIAMLALAMAAIPSPVLAQTTDPAHVAAKVDSIAEDWIANRGVAGMSIALIRNGEPLVLKGYGYAHVELHVPTPERGVYEIADRVTIRHLLTVGGSVR